MLGPSTIFAQGPGSYSAPSYQSPEAKRRPSIQCLVVYGEYASPLQSSLAVGVPLKKELPAEMSLDGSMDTAFLNSLRKFETDGKVVLLQGNLFLKSEKRAQRRSPPPPPGSSRTFSFSILLLLRFSHRFPHLAWTAWWILRNYFIAFPSHFHSFHQCSSFILPNRAICLTAGNSIFGP